MSDIKKLYLPHLRNEEWFEFMKQIVKLIKDDNASYAGTSPQISELSGYCDQADLALKQQMKSPLTAELVSLDAQRERLYNGLKLQLESMTHHFTESYVTNAYTLLDLFKNYGNLRKQSYTEETGTIYNLVKDLQEKYSEIVSGMGLTDWVLNLKTANDNFLTKLQNRDAEKSEKYPFTMLEIRREADLRYHYIIKKMEALALVHSDVDTYEEVIGKINAAIERNRILLAHRYGKNALPNTPITPEPGTDF
ncbi:MAG: DUF6261 family protein [Bacteroidales bacterium]|jgi:hypothetical protein|nr:DUF6261 family protein [Bacteroidales bacterium]